MFDFLIREKVKHLKLYSTVFSIYYIFHNPVDGEDKKNNWLVNMFIIFEKLGLVQKMVMQKD